MRQATQEKMTRIDFRLAANGNKKAAVAGTFNNWKPASMALLADKEGPTYHKAVMLHKGTHEYKFLVDGQWLVDPNNQEWTRNDLGTLNSVIHF